MKKTALIICGFILFLSSHAVMALETHLGLKAGISRSFLNLNKDVVPTDIDPINRFSVGVLFGINLSRIFGARFELDYSKKGGIPFFETTGLDGQLIKVKGKEISGDYLELPILFVFNPLSDKIIHPYLLCGPSFAFKIKVGELADIIPQIDLGLGIRMWKFIIEARYYYSLTTYPHFSKMRPRGSTITLGYTYN